MKRIRSQRSRVVKGSIENVFNTLVDRDHLTRPESGFQLTGQQKGSIDVGSQLVQNLRIHGRKVKTTFEVVDIKRNRMIELENITGPIQLRQRIQFDPVKKSFTRVTVETIGKPAIPGRTKRITSEIQGVSEFILDSLLPGDTTTPPPPPELRH